MHSSLSSSAVRPMKYSVVSTYLVLSERSAFTYGRDVVPVCHATRFAGETQEMIGDYIYLSVVTVLHLVLFLRLHDGGTLLFAPVDHLDEDSPRGHDYYVVVG
jgi:hypothetical protein